MLVRVLFYVLFEPIVCNYSCTLFRCSSAFLWLPLTMAERSTPSTKTVDAVAKSTSPTVVSLSYFKMKDDLTGGVVGRRKNEHQQPMRQQGNERGRNEENGDEDEFEQPQDGNKYSLLRNPRRAPRYGEI